jgi:hypothetical protein
MLCCAGPRYKPLDSKASEIGLFTQERWGRAYSKAPIQRGAYTSLRNSGVSLHRSKRFHPQREEGRHY